MQPLLTILRTLPGIAALVAILLLLPLIWLFGPLLPIGAAHPLEPGAVRLVLCLVVLLGGLAGLWYTGWRRLRRDAALVAAAGEPDPGRAAVAEEETALREKLSEALGALQRSGGKRRYLYDIPWYVLIGPPGSGKTTALSRSGLEFPLADGKLTGVGGTRNCDWWLCDRAVLLDTAGRYTTQESDAAADREGWRRFLQILRRARPRQPLNGIIVAFGVDLIARLDAAGRELHARAVRRRIQELQEGLAQRLPVYLLVSKADLLPGFVETFDSLDREARRQVWGMTFPNTDSMQATADGLEARFAAEFAGLLHRLQEGLLERLQAERGPAQRAAIAGFPAQLASLETPLAGFLRQAFSSSRLEPAPFLRGVYLTSGTQEGSPIDRLTGAMSRSFGLDARRVAAAGGQQGRSYFLGRLLTDVIFNEARLAAGAYGADRRRRVIGIAAWTLAGLVILGGAVWGWTALQREELRVANVDAARARLEASAQSLHLDPVADANLLPVLPYLDAAADLVQAAGDGGGLLDQSAELRAGASTAYRHVLDRVLLPRLLLRLEQQIRGNLQRPDFLYEAVRVYLMLGHQGPLDAGLVRDWMQADWAQSYPGALAAPQRAALTTHLQALLGQDFAAYPLDGQLVDAARRVFSRLPMAQRVLTRLRNAAQGIADWTPADALGPAGQKLFVRLSGKPLTDGVPALYTVDGLYHGVLPRLPQAVREAAAESWVLGPEAQADGAQDPVRLESDILARYAAAYGDAWQRMLDDLTMAPVAGLAQQAAVLNIVGAPDSPLRDLMRSIARQVSPGTPPDPQAAADPQAARVADAQGQKAANPGARVGQIVEARFAALRAAAGAPLDANLRSLNALYVQVAGLAAAPPGTSPPPPPAGALDPGQEVLAEAARAPEPLARVLQSAASSAQKARGGGVRAAVAAAAAAQLAPLCRGIESKFPFRRDGAEMPIDDFTRLFGPGGTFDQFFAQNIKAYADTTTPVWRPVALGGLPPPVSAADLAQFQRAQAVRDAFFPSAAGLRFDLLPLGLDGGAKSAILDAEGVRTDLASAGSGRPILLGWPARGNVTLSFEPLGSAGALSLDGAWSSLRLVLGPAATLQPEGGSHDRFRLAVHQGEHTANFLLRAGSATNPFSADLRQFRCPALTP